MSDTAIKQFDMIRHPAFPKVDQLLRAGGNVGNDDMDLHGFVHESELSLTAFYSVYGCELVKTPEDVYYLTVGEGSIFSTRKMTRLEMIVGKTLALMYLDPQTHSNLGRLTLDGMIHSLEMNPGRDVVLLHAQIRHADEEIANKKLREDLRKALARLGKLNFLQWDAYADEIVPNKALLRFAEDVRTGQSASENLAASIRAGSVVLSDIDLTQPEGAEDE